MNHDRLWNRIASIINPSEREKAEAERLALEWERRGHLLWTSTDLLGLSDGVISALFSRLEEERSDSSPHRGEPHSGWLARSDITFYNIRACGLRDSPGNFLQAAKLLLGERAHAIHLAPFTCYDHNTIYAIVATRSVAPELWHPLLTHAGLMPIDQVRAFVRAAHLLGKAVGFDLEPHTAQFSYPVLEHPEAFRWIKVYTPDPRWLDYLFTPDTVYEIPNQERIVREVQVLMREFLSQEGIRTFEEEDGDDQKVLFHKRDAFQRGVRLLIRHGYWTVPSHAWCGYGLPRFRGFNIEQNYPEFFYRDPKGNDVSAHSYHILTPFNFWDGLPVENSFDWENRARAGRINPHGVSLYCNLFLFWRDQVDMDFVRFDSVDHIWDSCDPHNPAIPFSDRPTPAVLRECNLAIRSGGRPDIASIAERLGSEARAYETLGFDVLLGSSMMEDPGPAMFQHDWQIAAELADLNRMRPYPFSVCVALDTHDTGNPLFRGKSNIEREGPDGLLFRLFLARFTQAGLSFRPLYSVMGLTDLSFGLYEANVQPCPLTWVGDRDFLVDYEAVENLYRENREFLNLADRELVELSQNGACWTYTLGKETLICAAAFPSGVGYFPPLKMGFGVAYQRLPSQRLKPGHPQHLPPLGFALCRGEL